MRSLQKHDVLDVQTTGGVFKNNDMDELFKHKQSMKKKKDKYLMVREHINLLAQEIGEVENEIRQKSKNHKNLSPRSLKKKV